MQTLIRDKGWLKMDATQRVKPIYNFVRDDIKFRYNSADNISASHIWKDGYGQCNTKATLLMTLLRASGIPNRIHGFTIDKALQKGAITGIWFKLSPKNILHSWVEVFIDENWYYLEGVILDKDCKTTFCGFGVSTNNFENPPVEWNLNHTFIQDKGINQGFGLFDTPDEFYAKYNQKLGAFRRFMFQKIARHRMNKNVSRIRNSM
ncbi:transglutaminase-like domain-containing protein [bacterium]|nr:transglutaminase-like domain-containing protein [bacterium]